MPWRRTSPYGLHGRRRAARIDDGVGDREHVFVVDRDDALENETLAVIPGQRDGMLGGQRLDVGGPQGVETGRLGARRSSQARSSPNRRRARRRGENRRTVRALRVYRLVIFLEYDVVDLAALEIDRAADARRVDHHPGACSQGLADRLGGRCGWGARDGRSRRARRAWRRGVDGSGCASLAGDAYWPASDWPASAPGARADKAGQHKNIATRPSPGPTARSRETGFACPRISSSRVSVLRRSVGRPAPATVRVAAPGGAKGGADIIDERDETTAQRLAPGHQHVIVIALRLKRLPQRATPLLAAYGRDCVRPRRRRSWSRSGRLAPPARLSFVQRLPAAGLQRESLN